MTLRRRVRSNAFVAALLLGSAVAQAHVPRHLAGTQVRILVSEKRVEVSLDLGYRGSWAQAEMLSIDANGDSHVNKAEADKYLETTLAKRVIRSGREAPHAIRCQLNGQDMELKFVRSLHEGLVGQVYPVPFSLYFVFEATPSEPLKLGEEHSIAVVDDVLGEEVPGLPRFIVPVDGHGDAERSLGLKPEFQSPPPEEVLMDAQTNWHVAETRKFEMRFTLREKPRAEGAEARVDLSGSDPAIGNDELTGGFFADAFDRFRRDGLASSLAFLALALLYGAGHAFTPGHGKSMVAAYLLGTNSRPRHAVLLGVATTISHAMTVFVIGAVVLTAAQGAAAASEGAVRNRVVVVCMLLSGALLLVLGAVMFFRRVGPLSKTHESDSTPDPATRDGAPPRVKELLSLGFSGGLVPCPAGLVVIGLALRAPEDLGFAIWLLLTFSAGLGIVLVLIGVLTVSGRRIVGDAKRDLGLLKLAPMASCLFIAGLGAYFVTSTIRSHPVEIRALLHWAGV